MNRVRFTLHADDLVAFYRLNFMAALKRRQTLTGYLLFLAIAAIVGVIGAWVFDLWSSLVFVTALATYAFLFFPLCYLISYARLKRVARRIYAQQKALQRETTVEWSAEGIVISTERSFHRLDWSDFIAMIEGKEALIFRQSDMLMNFIPRAALTSEQVQDIARSYEAAGGVVTRV